MHETRPLPDTHPEFTVYHWPGFSEYRVENWRLARDGSGGIIRGTSVCSWVDISLVLVVASVLCFSCEHGAKKGCSACCSVPYSLSLSLRVLITIGIVLTYLIWVRCTQVLYESLLVFPDLGIQLETHRGHPTFPNCPLSTTRHFIPLDTLEDVVIHEGFRRWDVRYYLAALHRVRTRRNAIIAARISEGTDSIPTAADSADAGSVRGVVEVRVAFENILPYFPVLKEVYLGVQQTLFPPICVAGSLDQETGE